MCCRGDGLMATSIISKGFEAYYRFVQKLADSVSWMIDERDFFSEAAIEHQVRDLGERYKQAEREMKLYRDRLDELSEEQMIKFKKSLARLQKTISDLAYLRSQKKEDLYATRSFLESLDLFEDPIYLCVQGLIASEEGRHEKAAEYLRGYFASVPDSAHYLANYVMAEICLGERGWRQVKRHAMRALYLTPDNVYLHTLMKTAHRQLGETEGERIEGEIVALLS